MLQYVEKKVPKFKGSPQCRNKMMIRNDDDIHFTFPIHLLDELAGINFDQIFLENFSDMAKKMIPLFSVTWQK